MCILTQDVLLTWQKQNTLELYAGDDYIVFKVALPR